MLQMLMLLGGTRLVRRFWWMIFVLGAFWGLLGILVHVDATFNPKRLPIHVFAFFLMADGLWTLIASFSSTGTTKKIRLVKSSVFLLISFLALFLPRESCVLVGILGGLFIMVDACWRAASACVVRFVKWRYSLAYACFQFLCGLWLVVPWPDFWANALGADMGMLVALSGISFCGHALRVRRMPSNMSIAALMNRSWPPENEPYVPSPKAFDSGEMVTVHVWTPTVGKLAPIHQGISRYVVAMDKNGVASTGHAALELSPDVYVSLYPLNDIDRSGSDFMRILNASSDNDVPGVFQESYAQESADWCPSTWQVELPGLNTEAIRRFWVTYRQDTTYNLTNRSCASSVAKALDAGLEGIFERRIRSSPLLLLRLLATPEVLVAGFMRLRAEAMAWTPGLVLDYARAVSYIISLPKGAAPSNNNTGGAE